MQKLLQQTIFILLIGSGFLTGCSQLRRAEKDIVKNIPGVERIEWMINAKVIGAANMECNGQGETVIEALKNVTCGEKK